MNPYAASTLVLWVLAVLLAPPAWTAPAPVESRSAEPEAGLVVETVRQGSTGHQAGIRPGDVLLGWSRPPQTASLFRSPFDLYDVSVEQLPRGPVTLAGRRGNEEASWVLPGGSPSIVEEIRTRPVLSAEILALYQEGEGAWERAAAAALERGEADTAVWLRARLAAAWMVTERWDEADSLYEETLQPLEEAGSPLAPHLLRGWGEALLDRRSRVLAKDCFRRALALDHQTHPESLAVAEDLSGLGAAALQEGAESYFRQALALREKLAPGSAQVAASWHDLGFDAEAGREFLRAVEHHRSALTLNERVTPQSIYVALSLSTLATAEYYRKDYRAAQGLFERALSLVEPLAPDDPLVSSVLQGWGMSLARQGDRLRALPLLERALAQVVRLNPGGLEELDAARDLGLIERQIGRTRSSAEHLCRAVEIVERKRKRQRNDEDRLRWGIYFADYYRDCSSVLVATGQTEEAFLILERGRSRSLVTFMAERELRTDLPRPLAEERNRLAAEYDRIQATLKDARDENELLQAEARLREIRWRREKLVQAAGQARPSPLPYPQPLALEEARKALDPGTVFLVYSTGEEETLLFLLQAPGDRQPLAPKVVRIPQGAPELERRIELFRLLLLTPGSSQHMLARQGKQLYDLLLRPAEPWLAAGERILISADGPLHALPFGALVRKGRYLIEWKPIHAVLSATAYAELRRSRRPPEDPRELRLAAFGDPLYPRTGAAGLANRDDPRLRAAIRGGLAPLPASRQEVEAIATLFPHSQVFLGEEATEEKVKTVGKEVRLLHFAVHGLLDPRLPNNSALALTMPENLAGERENGLLQVWEIVGSLHLDADLVTLSACRTGLGKEGGGEGLIGLTRAFQMAGARSVVATLWPVADTSTADLMKRFYEHLRQGETKDRALQAAQREQMRSRETSHPFHWAAFQLYGDWR